MLIKVICYPSTLFGYGLGSNNVIMWNVIIWYVIMWNVIICDMKWPLNSPRKYGKLKVWWIGKQPGRLSGHDFHVCLWDLLCGCGASRQVGSISISKNKAPLLLLLHRVKWSPFIHFHCFLLSQPKLGCGASRKTESIFIL